MDYITVGIIEASMSKVDNCILYGYSGGKTFLEV